MTEEEKQIEFEFGDGDEDDKRNPSIFEGYEDNQSNIHSNFGSSFIQNNNYPDQDLALPPI